MTTAFLPPRLPTPLPEFAIVKPALKRPAGSMQMMESQRREGRKAFVNKSPTITERSPWGAA